MKRTIFLIGVLVALILAIVADFIADGKILGNCSPKKRLQEQLLKNEIKSISEKYQGKNALLLQEFERKLASAGREDFDRADRNVNQTVREMTSYKNCAILCCKKAQDMVRKTQKTQEFIRNLTGSRILEPCQKGHAQINNLLLEFLHKLQENDNQYRSELALLAQNDKNGKLNQNVLNEFVKKNVKIEEKMEDLALAKVLAAAGGVLEIIFIKGTVKVVTRCCSRVIAKLATTGTAAATSAVADGPLLIGDVIGGGIAVAGIAWTAYDLYKVHVTLPREMRVALHSMIRQYENGSRQEALKTAQKAIQRFDSNTQNIINSL